MAVDYCVHMSRIWIAICHFTLQSCHDEAFMCTVAGGMCLLCCSVYFTGAELFTAVVDLERILHAEYEVAQDLRNYVENEQRRIDTLRR